MSRRASMVTAAGFTLLEILIALFIFTILSLMMMNGLHSVIDIQTSVEEKAEQLRQLQFALLIVSIDIQQAVDRPITNPAGREEASFIGTPNSMSFTHLGYAMATGQLLGSGMQRTSYVLNNNTLSRLTWPTLDQAPNTRSHARPLLSGIESVRYEYLGQDGRFYNSWPASSAGSEPLPRAVRVFMEIPSWGKFSQLFVISSQAAGRQ